MKVFKKAFTLAEVPEALQHGSHQELSAVAKVEPEARQHGSKRVAFTLAEVLITLGIIGIVAAMTIPTLMQNYQKRILENQFKSTVSILKNAIALMKANNDNYSIKSYYTVYDPAKGGYYRQAEFRAELEKYLKVQDKSPKTLSYKTYDGSQTYGTSDSSRYSLSTDNYFVLSNGSYIHYGISCAPWYQNYGSNDCFVISFAVDINGSQGPNRAGFDLFHFLIATEDDVLQGIGMYRLLTDEEAEQTYFNGIEGAPCSIKSKQVSNGYGCAGLAMKNVCPDDETKTYWECLP